MKPLAFLSMLFLVNSCGPLFGQGSLGGVEANGKFGNSVFLSDAYGRPVKPQPADVNGTPFFNNEYRFADILLGNGRRFKSVKVRLDMDTQEMHFMSANGTASFMEAGSVKEIAYTDTAAVITHYLFRTGYPAIDGKNDRNFYQVMVDGKAELLRSVEKKISERKDELSGIITKDYESREEYYLLVKGDMKRLKKERGFLLAAFPDQTGALEAYMRSNKINAKNLQDIIKLVNYYNSL